MATGVTGWSGENVPPRVEEVAKQETENATTLNRSMEGRVA